MLSLKGGGTKQFNSSGKLILRPIEMETQRRWLMTATDFLVSATDPFGRVLTFHTNENGQVSSISDSLGNDRNLRVWRNQ